MQFYYSSSSRLLQLGYLSRPALWLLRVVLLGVGLLGFQASVQAQLVGRVYRDFNANGAQDSPISSTVSAIGEPGFPGIIVTAHPVTGSSVSVATGVDGSYSFPNSGVTASGAKLRLEFSGLPSGVYSSAYGTATTGSGTSVQFVTAGSSTTANYGVNYPGDFCDSSPQLATPCFVSGTQSAAAIAGEHVLVTFPFTAQSTNTGTLANPVASNNVNPTPIADAGQIGSVWGMAFQRETGKLFTAAFLKRHVGLGSGGLGGVYSTSNATGSTTNGTLYVDLEASPFNLDLGQSLLGTRTLPTSATASSTDPNSFSLIGKVGLGGMAISDDGTKLYVVDLYNKKLLILNIGNPAKASLLAGDLTQVTIPTPNCTNGASQPFGISVWHGKVYVGVVCTAENAGGTAANLNMSVYEMDESTQTFNATAVLTAPLNYPKGYVHAQQIPLGNVWEPWTSSFATLNITLLSPGAGTTSNPVGTATNPVIYRTAQPQPILSDIDFTDNGDMVLTMMDRAGHQLGYRQVSPTSVNSFTLFSGYVGGDLLRARKQGAAWVLESAGQVSSSTSGTLTGCGSSTQGPGNGEFYCSDNYIGDNDRDGVGEEIHQETSQGGSVIVPGTNQTVTIHMDPMATWSGGTIWHSNSTGVRSKVYQLYRTIDNTGAQINGTYGKANGLGLPVALCDPAPVEIGNRVWFDKDKDGVQDPDETPIASVTVGLYQSGSLVATAVTNSKGEYYFSSATGTSSTAVRYGLNLIRGGAYELRIPTSQSALTGYVANSPANAVGNDAIDNDFSVSGSNLVASLTVGMSGNNQHLFDAAVVCATPVSPGLTSTPATCTGTTGQNNGLITISASVTNANRYALVSGTVTTGFAYSAATAMPTAFPANLITNAPNAGATYTVRFYSGSNDCFLDEVVVVAPRSCSAPVCSLTASAQASSQTVCTNQSVTVFATVTPTGSYTYSWAAPAGAVIAGGSSATATISGLTTTGVKTFTVTVSSSPSCSTIATVSVTVQELVVRATIFSSGASSATFCQGTQAPALANYIDAGDTNTPVQWYGPSSSTATLGALIPGATNSTYTPVGSETLAAGIYYYAVVAAGQACTATAFVQIIGQNCTNPCIVPAVSLVSGSQTVCVDGTSPTALTANLVSGTATAYKWYGPLSSTSAALSTSIAGANTNTLGVSGFVGDAAGTFYFAVVVQNGPASCSAVAYAQVVVNNPPELSQLPTQLCAGGTIDILSSFSVANGPIRQIRIYRTVADQTSNVNSLTNTIVSLTATTTFYVSMTNTAGCSWQDETTITVSPLPNAGTDQSLSCVSGVAPTSTTLSATSATSGQWRAAAGNPTATTFGSVSGLTTSVNGLNVPGSYTFVFTTPQSCSDAVVVTVPACTSNPGTINLQFATVLNCATNSYSATIQARSADLASLSIGNSSILFTYNPASLSFASYQPISFNGGAWDVQAFDGSTPGTFNLTLTLLQNTNSNPPITNSGWVNIGTVIFTLTNPGSVTANPLLAFDAANTNFNSVPANDGTNPIRKGTFTGVSAPGSLSCSATPLGSIGDFVWKDLNSNGIQDDGVNSGISDVPVNLLKETAPGQFSSVATTNTSQAGFYSFTGLTAGNYKVRVDVDAVPFYCQPTTQTVVTPNDATNSKINPQGETPVIVIDPSNPTLKDYPKADAGFKPVPLGSLGDYVWKDTNNDGIQNDGNTGAANIGLKLLNSDGVYVIRGMLSGSQEVPAVLTSGSGLIYGTFNPANNNLMLVTGFNNLSGTVSMAHIHTGVAGVNGPVMVDLVPAGFPTGVRTGNAVTNTVLTTAQRDLLLANQLYVNVHTSINGGGEVRAQLMACEFTNSSGNYLFTNLPADTYTVAVDTKTVPATCVISSKQNSTSATEATDSDFNPTTGISDPVTVNPNDPATRDIRTVDLALVSTPVSTPTLRLNKFVSKRRARLGEVVSYTVTLTNTGPVGATSVIVSDTFTTGIALVPGSISVSAGSYTPALNGGTWAIASLPVGATVTLTYSASLTRDGVMRNTASLPGQDVEVCTTVPMMVCAGQPFAIQLTAEPGYDRYQWFLTAPGGISATQVGDGTLNSFTATQAGEYQVIASSLSGTSCPNGSCCPLIIEEQPVPVAPGMATQSASCSSLSAATANADARIILSTTALSGLTYNIAKGSSFTASAPLYGSAQTLPTQIGSVLATGLANPATVAGDSYTIRIYQGDCFVDVVVTLQQTNCACEVKCVPVVIRRTR